MRRKYGAGSTPTDAIHCQLPLFCAGSPSSSSRAKCASPSRQSRCRSLVRNEPTTSRARLCIQPVARELAHPGVDERKPVRPSRQAASSSRRRRHPSVAVALLELVADVVRVVQQDVGVEVAPARAGAPNAAAPAPPRRRARCSHSRARQAAPAQVGRQPARAAVRALVALGVVRRPASPASARSARARRGLARLDGRLGTLAASSPAPRRGIRPGAAPTAAAAARAARGARGGARRPPRARERREHRVGLAGLRPRPADVDDVVAAVGPAATPASRSASVTRASRPRA